MIVNVVSSYSTFDFGLSGAGEGCSSIGASSSTGGSQGFASEGAGLGDLVGGASDIF